MSKYLKILFVAMFALGLSTSTAFGAALSNANTGTAPAYTIATEVVGTNTYTSNDVYNVFYNSSVALASGYRLKFNFANATITDSSLSLCNSSNSSIATLASTPSTSAGLSEIVFALTSATTANEMIWIGGNSTTACGGVLGYTAAGAPLNWKFPVMAKDATVTVAATATFSDGTTIPGGTVSATTWFTVGNQWVLTNIAGAPLTAYTDTAAIDFTSGRKKIIAAAGAAAGTKDTATAISFALSAKTIGVNWTSGDKFTITLAGSMTGIARICYDDTTCDGTSKTAADSTIASTFTLATNSATYVYSSLSNTTIGKAITFVVDGTTVLAPRTFTISAVHDVTESSNYQDRTLTPDNGDYFGLTLASYQGLIPYISANSTYKTICMVNNGYTLAGEGVVDIITSESGATLLSNQSVGTIAVGATKRVDFDGSLTPYTWTSGAETAGTPIALGLNAADRYSARVTINANADDVSMNCIQLDPAGSKRAVPVLSNSASKQ